MFAGTQSSRSRVRNDPDSPRPDLDHPDWLPRLQGVREALLLGDRRPLYLAWLARLQDAPTRPDASAPCVPPGLQALPESHQALAEFLRLDPYPLQAAAEASPTIAEPTTDLTTWITALPEADKTNWLLRLLGEEASADRVELRRRHLQETTPPSAPGPRLTPQAIQDRAQTLRLQAHAETKRLAAEARDRRATAAARARQQHLDHLATRLPDLWLKVRNLIDEGQPKPYDQAIALLQELRDLARQRDREPAFEQALAALRQQYARRVGLNQRLAKAGLDGKPPPAPSPAPTPKTRR